MKHDYCGYDKTFFKTIQRASNVPRTDAPQNKPIKRTAGHTLRCYIKSSIT